MIDVLIPGPGTCQGLDRRAAVAGNTHDRAIRTRLGLSYARIRPQSDTKSVFIPDESSFKDPRQETKPASPRGETGFGAGKADEPFAYSDSAEPPAASIFALADAEYAFTLTLTLTAISPEPRILTTSFLRTAPLATRSATVTSPPCG